MEKPKKRELFVSCAKLQIEKVWREQGSKSANFALYHKIWTRCFGHPTDFPKSDTMALKLAIV